MPNDFLFANIAGDEGRVDVIFVHGLRGDAVDTWASPVASEADGALWPTWLVADAPGTSAYTLGFPASWFASWARKEMNLYERAKQTLETLAGYGIGGRPIVFVCHSLGGLLVKYILRAALESSDPAWRAVADSCRAIFFIATPHAGSSIANVLKLLSLGLASSHISALRQGNDEIAALNESCRSNCSSKGIRVWSYYEMFATKPIGIVVDRESADPGIGDALPIPIDANHIEISRPPSRDSTIYLSVRRHVRDIVRDSEGDAQSTQAFKTDALGDMSGFDRRDLHSKLTAANREHEYRYANESQTLFAIQYTRTGLMRETRRVHDQLLADVEQAFMTFVYLPLVARGASSAVIDVAIQDHIVAPLSAKYATADATSKTIKNAIYFLAEKCHIRWDAE